MFWAILVDHFGWDILVRIFSLLCLPRFLGLRNGPEFRGSQATRNLHFSVHQWAS
ncbi:unnamed protein product [Prunus brigantina]